VTHRTDAQDDSLVNSSTETRVDVKRTELPLSCPLPDEKLWNAHPRVYLPIEDSGEASCPYCGTHYILAD